MMQRGETAETIEERVIARAMRDEAFRRELIASPREVLNRELGGEGKIPDGVEIKVVEETPDTVYLVLPPPTPSAHRELSDADLDRASGGATMCGIGGPDLEETWNMVEC